MSSYQLFITTILAIAIPLTLYTAYRSGDFKGWFKSKAGLGVLKGIVIATVVMLAAPYLFSKAQAEEGRWLNDASAFFGLDYTKNVSPQCVEGTGDDHTTSNLGFKLNLYESYDGKFRANSKYTHHSCAFATDRNSYDALGFELEYKFWSR